MTLSSKNYDRLIYLSQRIKSNSASKAEKDEYMEILYENGNITRDQFDKYLSDTARQEEIVNAALTIGGILVVAYLLDRLIK